MYQICYEDQEVPSVMRAGNGCIGLVMLKELLITLMPLAFS